MHKSLIITFIISVFLLTSCSQNTNHLPSVFDIPSVIGSVFENATYSAKRKKVAAYVKKHYLGLRDDVSKGGGKVLEGALDVAGIKQSKRDKARQILISSKKQTYENTLLVTDSLVQVFATLYANESSAKDKRINGFSYIEARQLIRRYAKNNFESLRVAIKQGRGRALDDLMTRLNIKNANKRSVFKTKAKSRYYTTYLDIVVTSIMINT